MDKIIEDYIHVVFKHINVIGMAHDFLDNGDILSFVSCVLNGRNLRLYIITNPEIENSSQIIEIYRTQEEK